MQAASLFDCRAQARGNTGVERNRDASHVGPLAAQPVAMLGDTLGEAGPIGEPRVAFTAALVSVIGVRCALGVLRWHAFDTQRDHAMACRDARRDINARGVRGTD